MEHKTSQICSKMREIQLEDQDSPETTLRVRRIPLRHFCDLMTVGAALHIPQEPIKEDHLMIDNKVAEIWAESQQRRSVNSRAGRGAGNLTKCGLWGMCRRTSTLAFQRYQPRA
jgi:hypothetical protein